MTDRADTDLATVRALLRPGARVAVLTGAGVSAASGVPTFRGGADSLWENRRPEELATPAAFARNPEQVWRWYDWRRGLVAACTPNAAHHALAALQDRVATLTVITQNVDGLHQRAGSRDVVEFHGSLWRVRCTRCGREREDRRVPLPVPPACPDCGGLLRPGVVWFGEAIPAGAMAAATAAVTGCDLLLVIGTSGVVYPAAGLARLAKEHGAVVAEFNLEPGGIAAWTDHFIAGGAETTVPRLLD